MPRYRFVVPPDALAALARDIEMIMGGRVEVEVRTKLARFWHQQEPKRTPQVLCWVELTTGNILGPMGETGHNWRPRGNLVDPADRSGGRGAFGPRGLVYFYDRPREEQLMLHELSARYYGTTPRGLGYHIAKP